MALTEIENVIKMRNGSKTYWESITKQQTVLKDMSISVPQGTIYGLLGPSGCGKTTLLKCILGRLSLDAGELEVFGHTPGTVHSCVPGPDIGYMPQELSLFEELSVGETWQYFGGISGMSKSAIRERSLFLQEFLNLPPITKLSKNLSGGQRRRVSFGCALLHEPKLLILDEPTVGVDPMLRKSIWDHLMSLSKQNVTVMITTHYIEEARTCHKVGFMLNGKLIGEDNPGTLMVRNNCLTLEEIFLKLCIQEDYGKNANGTTLYQEDIKKKLRRQSSIRFEEESLLEGAAIAAGNIKNGAAVINGDSGNGMKDEDTKIEMPPKSRRSSIMSFSRRLSFGMPRRMRASVDLRKRQRLTELQTYTDFVNSLVDRDRLNKWFRIPKFHRFFAVFLKSSIRSYRAPGAMLFQFFLPAIIMILVCVAIGRPITGITLGIVNKDNDDYGEKFLSYVRDEVITKIPYDSFEDAVHDTHEGGSWGVIRIGENFTEALLGRLMQGALTDESNAIQSNINISMDLSNPFITFTVTRELFLSFQSFLAALVERQGFSKNIVSFPIVYTDHIFGSIEEKFTDFVIPGITLFIVFFISMGCTGLSFTMQKQSGLFDRSYIAGVTPMEIVLGEMMANLWTVAAQTFSTLLIAFGVYQMEYSGSIFIVITLTFLQGVCGVACGIFISSVFDQELTVTMGGLSVLFPSLILTGALWPLEGVNSYIRLAAAFFPQTFSVEALRSVIFRGWTMSYFPVYMGYVTTTAWLVLFSLSSSMLFQLKE